MRRVIVSWKRLAGNGNFVDSRHRHRCLRGSAIQLQCLRQVKRKRALRGRNHAEG
jgi:hypothetical protein